MPLDEIIVRGTRRRFGRDPDLWLPRGGSLITGGTFGLGPGGVGERNPSIDLPTGAFVPPVLPGPITEIIVKGKVPARPSFGFGKPATLGPAALFALVGGLLIREILEERGQAMVDKALAETLARKPRKKRDTAVIVQQPQLIPEIRVTAKRRQFVRALQRIPQPLPLITPDADPFVLIPFLPRVLPAPVAVPDPMVAPPTIPQPQRTPANVPTRFLPLTIPTFVPLRTSPLVSPERRVAPAPQVSPQPATSPLPAPGISPAVAPSAQPATRRQTQRLTSTQSSLLQSLRRQLSQRGQTATQSLAAAQGKCVCPKAKKCEKEKEKPRDKCYRKLVKERLLPSMDTSYEWAEIDCITGREL